MLGLILLIFALVLFVVAAVINPAEPWRGKLALLGLACWVAAEIFARAAPLLGGR
jgi:hypothetical protein